MAIFLFFDIFSNDAIFKNEETPPHFKYLTPCCKQNLYFLRNLQMIPVALISIAQENSKRYAQRYTQTQQPQKCRF